MRAKLLALVVVLAVAVVGPAAAATGGTAASAATQTDCSFPVTATDATGTEVTVSEEPERITVLGPSTAQTMWEIGAREKVVALPHQYAGYLDGVSERTDVSGSGRTYVSNERVVNTSADLVLAPNVITDDTVATLRDAGMTVFKFEEATSIADVYDKTDLTGRLVGECDGAAETVLWMKDRIGDVTGAVADEERPLVFISMGQGFTAGSDTFIHEIVTTAGAENLAARANLTGYPEISSETVVQHDPEWIIQNGEFAAYPKTEAYNGTTAVQEGQVFTVDSNHASQPAPRIVYAIENVTQRLHPEAYEQAMSAGETTTAQATTGATAQPTTETMADETTEATAETTAAATDETADTTASGGQAGFGVAAAVAALLGAALVAVRRR